MTLRQKLSTLKTSIVGILQPHRVRYCPVCGHSSLRFFDAGVHDIRPDAQCPWCNSVERHRFIFPLLQRETNLFDGSSKRLLHIAPEPHFEGQFRSRGEIEYITGDLNPDHADCVVDVTEMTFPDAHFDAILCSHVLEHVPDDRRAMREFFRVLKPGGWALLAVPLTVEKTIEDPSITDPTERLRLFGQEDHVRCYGPDYFDRLREAGFEVSVFDESYFGDREFRRMRLMKSERIPLCRKPS